MCLEFGLQSTLSYTQFHLLQPLENAPAIATLEWDVQMLQDVFAWCCSTCLRLRHITACCCKVLWCKVSIKGLVLVR